MILNLYTCTNLWLVSGQGIHKMKKITPQKLKILRKYVSLLINGLLNFILFIFSILCGCYDNTLRLWSTSGQPLMTIPGHSAPVKCVRWISIGMDIAFLIESPNQIHLHFFWISLFIWNFWIFWIGNEWFVNSYEHNTSTMLE